MLYLDTSSTCLNFKKNSHKNRNLFSPLGRTHYGDDLMWILIGKLPKTFKAVQLLFVNNFLYLTSDLPLRLVLQNVL